MAKWFILPIIHPDTDAEVFVTFGWRPASGDGWHEPHDPGGPEFISATTADGDPAPPDLAAWTEAEFENHHAEAADVVAQRDEMDREYVADRRGDNEH